MIRPRLATLSALALAMASAPLCPGSEPTLRVLVWNLHHGQGGDGEINLPRIAARIREANPDVVLIQEIDQNCTRSGFVDQPAELGRLVGMHPAFGRAIDLQGGQYGLAILSRGPLQEPRVHPLPGEGESRILFTATLSHGGTTLTLANTHLDHQSPEARTAQTAAIHRILEPLAMPIVLAGDFNATPDSPEMAVLRRPPWTFLTKADPPATFPAHQPKVEIDHVITRGLPTPSVPHDAPLVTVINEPIASDHRPLLVAIPLPPAPE
jgi:endonuclease/exonuclease/phosphatase family metal-dependent hydrolase